MWSLSGKGVQTSRNPAVVGVGLSAIITIYTFKTSWGRKTEHRLYYCLVLLLCFVIKILFLFYVHECLPACLCTMGTLGA